MKRRNLSILCVSGFLTACSGLGKPNAESLNTATDSMSLTKLDSLETPAHFDSSNDSEIDLQESEMMDFFVVVSDTSYNYYKLRSQLISTSKKFKIDIDSMGRFYNGRKHKIQLPDDDEDEIYAGEYFPRRYESSQLSIEYASQYLDHCNDSLMAGIMGIYIKEEEARNRLLQIKSLNPGAFVTKASLYQGCMH